MNIEEQIRTNLKATLLEVTPGARILDFWSQDLDLEVWERDLSPTTNPISVNAWCVYLKGFETEPSYMQSDGIALDNGPVSLTFGIDRLRRYEKSAAFALSFTDELRRAVQAVHRYPWLGLRNKLSHTGLSFPPPWKNVELNDHLVWKAEGEITVRTNQFV